MKNIVKLFSVSFVVIFALALSALSARAYVANKTGKLNGYYRMDITEWILQLLHFRREYTRLYTLRMHD